MVLDQEEDEHGDGAVDECYGDEQKYIGSLVVIRV